MHGADITLGGGGFRSCVGKSAQGFRLVSFFFATYVFRGISLKPPLTIRITEVVVLSFKMHRPMGMGRIHRHAAHRIDHAALPGRTISSRRRRVGRTVYSSRTWKVGRTNCLNSTLVLTF